MTPRNFFSSYINNTYALYNNILLYIKLFCMHTVYIVYTLKLGVNYCLTVGIGVKFNQTILLLFRLNLN